MTDEKKIVTSTRDAPRSKAYFYAPKESLKVHVSLDCLTKTESIELPTSLKRSITADVVNGIRINYYNHANLFLKLREQFFNNRKTWIQALQQYYFVNNPTNRSVQEALLTASHNLKLATDQYWQNLLALAETGIWNCMEFADFALIKIFNVLKNGYEAHVAHLHDIKIPAEEYFEYFKSPTDQTLDKKLLKQIDHDHAFVIITKNHQLVFAIDLWQVFANKKAFYGTIDEFTSFLNDRVDGKYVARKVTPDDFEPSTLFGDPNNASVSSSSSSGQITGFEENRTSSMANFP